MTQNQLATDFGKLPPQALDLETAVLGAVLLESNCLDDIQDIIDENVFYKETNQVLYKAIKGMHTKGEQIDILTLVQHLNKAGKLDEVGGASYISSLTAKVASAGHVQFHASILKQKAIQRNMIRLASDLLNKAYDDSVDVEELIQFAGREVDAASETMYSAKREVEFAELLEMAAKELEQREKAAKEGGYIGIPTGVQDLNKMTGGWQNGDLIIVAGRPSMGKTAVALQFIKEAAEAGKHAAVFSLEMQAVRLADRLITGQANIDPEKFRNGRVTTEDWKAIEKVLAEMSHLPVSIDDNPVVNMEYIKARCRIKKRKGKCDFIVIDYLGLVEADGGFNKNREREVAEISRQAKILAKELDVPVILLSQLNRSCESRPDKRPMLADLRESGAIEQDADMVILLHRPGKYGIEYMEINGEEVLSENIGEFIIAKQRNGRIGTVVFKHNPALTRIFDYVPDQFMPSGFDKEKPKAVVVDNSDLEDIAAQAARDFTESTRNQSSPF